MQQMSKKRKIKREGLISLSKGEIFMEIQCYCGCNKKVIAMLLAGNMEYYMCEQCAIDYLVNNKKAKEIYNVEYNELQLSTDKVH